MAVPRRSPASTQGARLAYMPALDGVRALAVAAVLLYVGDVSWAGGGYLGVDAFYVLSGFLITSLLAEWRGEGRIALSQSLGLVSSRSRVASVTLVAWG